MRVSGHESVILCIDDEPVALETRRLVLVRAGYKVLTASDGPSGMEVFRDEHIDLVITDHLLPGQTGGQVAEEMKRLKPEVPVAMLSGLVERPEGASATDVFLVKGIPVPEFLAAITALLQIA